MIQFVIIASGRQHAQKCITVEFVVVRIDFRWSALVVGDCEHQHAELCVWQGDTGGTVQALDSAVPLGELGSCLWPTTV